VRIDCYEIGAAGLRDLGGFLSAYGLRSDGAVLVRPDGQVAWRSQSAPATGTELADALAQILARLQAADA
jgi:hypothetical protein